GDAVRTGRNDPIDVDVRANDSDPDGDGLTVEGATQPQHGSAAIQPDGTVRYTPDDGFEGTDGFTYTVTDGRGGTASAPVAVHVATYTLSVAKTGNGRVTSTPAGIDCGTTCSADFVNGSPRPPAAPP